MANSGASVQMAKQRQKSHGGRKPKNRAEVKLLGLALKRVRESAGLSQSELAEVLEVQKYIVSAYEQGRREPSFLTAHRIALALGKTVADIIHEYQGSVSQESGPSNDSPQS